MDQTHVNWADSHDWNQGKSWIKDDQLCFMDYTDKVIRRFSTFKDLRNWAGY